jgi:hypothetical protein
MRGQPRGCPLFLLSPNGLAGRAKVCCRFSPCLVGFLDDSFVRHAVQGSEL